MADSRLLINRMLLLSTAAGSQNSLENEADTLYIACAAGDSVEQGAEGKLMACWPSTKSGCNSTHLGALTGTHTLETANGKRNACV